MKRGDAFEYLARSRSIDGWLFTIDALIFAAVDEAQKARGVKGNLFEIGVHHGKTAVLLERLRSPGESTGFCDLFSRQDLNVDASGKGDRAVFEGNFRSCQGYEPTNIVEKSSHELTAAETTTACRLFHVDGGHRATDVINDLNVADRALTQDGIAVIDDVFNPSWPGVSEGFHQFMGSNPRAFVPLIIGGNKVFVCRPAAREEYSRSLSPDAIQGFVALPEFRFRAKEWYGTTVSAADRLAWLDLRPLTALRLRLAGGGWRDFVAQAIGSKN